MNDIQYQEHIEYEANAASDYHSELWASELESMSNEGFNVECEIVADYIASDEFVGAPDPSR